MAEELLSLEIATPSGLALQTECESLAAPSSEGEFGVFPGHRPLLATLRAGVVRYVVGGKDLRAAVGPGFVEAGPHKVLLLTDTFALPEDVDVESVRGELSAMAQQANTEALNTIKNRFDEAMGEVKAATDKASS